MKLVCLDDDQYHSSTHVVKDYAMKLLTHNMLTSHVKGVKNGYPLRLLVRTDEHAIDLVLFSYVSMCLCVCPGKKGSGQHH